MTTRQERINEMLKVEISDIIRRELKDPRLGFITVTDAEITKDLRYAKVFISVMGTEAEQQNTLKILQRASGFIRGVFGHRVSMKVIPEIQFRIDTGVQHGMRIFDLLQQIKSDEQKQV